MSKNDDWILFEEEKPENCGWITVMKKDGEIVFCNQRVACEDEEPFWFSAIISDDSEVLKWRYANEEDMKCIEGGTKC